MKSGFLSGTMGTVLVAALAFVACADDDPGPGPGAGGDASGGAGTAGAGVVGQGVAGQGGIASGEPANGGASGAQGGAGISEAGAAGESAAGANTGGASSPGHGAGGACNGDESELDEERTKFCVLLASCTAAPSEPHPPRPDKIWTSDCISYGTENASFWFYVWPPEGGRPLPSDARATACPSSTDSCEDVLACAGYRGPIDECDGTAGTRCEGELAINCGERSAVTDCARTTGETGTCKVANGRAVCDTGQQCVSASSPQACDGNTLFSCASGVSDGTDCTQFGLICHEFGDKAACATPPPSTTCDELDTPACDGSKRTYCTPDGVLYEHECNGAAPLTCVKAYDSQPMDRFGLDCAPEGCVNSNERHEFDACEGDDLRLGTLLGIVLHCPDYGFATCRNGVCAD